MGNSTATKNLPLTGMQILLVEDCPDQGRLYLEVLKNAGAQVWLECNGQSAIDAVRKAISRYHAIVMDFQMPGMDGLDATWKIRLLEFNGAIIAFTMHDSDDLRESWNRAGCDVFLPKPVTPALLIEAVQQQVNIEGVMP